MSFKDFKYEGVIFKLDTPTRNGYVYQKERFVEILQSERIHDLLENEVFYCKTEPIRSGSVITIDEIRKLSVIDIKNSAIKIHKLWIDGNDIHAIISPMNDEMYKKLDQQSPIYFSILSMNPVIMDSEDGDNKIIYITHFVNFSLVDFCLFDDLDGKFKRIYE